MVVAHASKYILWVANGSTRILLVDDEQSIQTLLSYPLRKDGYHVTSALDGRKPWSASMRGASTWSSST